MGLRVVEAGGRVVALLEGRGAHHLRVAVVHHEVVGAQWWCLGTGDLRGVGHPWLLVGHHAGRAALLLDLRASLRHQTQDWPITVHVRLGLDAVHKLRSPEAGCHEEAAVHAASWAVVRVHLGADHLRSDAGTVGRGAALFQGVVASRVRVCLVEASALPLRGGKVPGAGSPLAVAVAAHGKDKIQHVVEVFILFARGEVAPGAAGGLGLLLALPPLGEERKGRRLAVRPGAGVGGSGAGRAAGAQRGSAGPGRCRTHFVERFLAAGAGEGGEGGQDGIAQRHGAAGRDAARRAALPPYNAGAGALRPIAGSGGNASRTGRAGRQRLERSLNLAPV